MNKKIMLPTLLLISSMLLILLLPSCTKKDPEPVGSLIIGSTASITGDWEGHFENEAADRDIATLISGYDTVVFVGDNALAYDKQVVRGIKESIDDEGNKTFTFTITKNLRYNDGTPITAKDYVARVLLFSSPVIQKAGSDGTFGANYIGWSDFQSGDKKEFSGVRLLDTYKFSLTVSKNYIPYYWDKAMVQINPLPLHAWLPDEIDIKDDGDGAYFTGNFSYEACKETIERGRYNSENRVSCGPFTLTTFDPKTKTATLHANMEYNGNYEGKKPRLAKLIYKQIDADKQFELMTAGEVELIRRLSAKDATTALEYANTGGFGAARYNRNGYGKLTFVCDFGPTQFVEVRQAIAHLIDRNALREAVCGPHGTVVNGPYGLSMRMCYDAKEALDQELNSYEKDAKKAASLLEVGGWTLALDGSPYSTGVRYKVVSKNEGADFSHCITLEDGRILMPLIIEWCSSADNEVTDLLREAFGQNPLMEATGIKVIETNLSWEELLRRLYRSSDTDEDYSTPKFGVFNLAGSLSSLYDPSYNYTLDESFFSLGYNAGRIKDAKLDQLSMELVYGVIPGDYNRFLTVWTDFVLLWNSLLPELPLYSNIYYDLYSNKLKNYSATDGGTLVDSLINCYIE